MYAILWTLFFISAAVFSFYALVSARDDLMLLDEENPDLRALRTIAVGDLREEIVRTIVYLSFSVVGVLSTFPAFQRGEPLNATIPTVLTLGGFGMLLNSVMAYFKRKTAIRQRVASMAAPVAKETTLLGVADDVARVHDSVHAVKKAADAAYTEANQVNMKIAAISKRVGVVEVEQDAAKE